MQRILLVEDQEEQLRRLGDILTAKFPTSEVHLAKGLQEAIRLIHEFRTMSIVITDYQLEDGNGYDVLAYVQDHLTNVPVIIITAYGRHEGMEVRPALSFKKGAVDFMHKPLGLEEIAELIERIKLRIEDAEARA